MSKSVLCNVPNTLFDSRHRYIESIDDFYITNVQNDELHYAVYRLVQTLHKAGYNVIFTHYCLDRLRPHLEQLLKSHNINPVRLYTNFATQDVHSNKTLKEHLCKEHYDFEYAIDNSDDMSAFYLEHGIQQIRVPLPLKFSD